MPLSRPNKASTAQRGAEGPDALQKQDQSFNSRSWPGGLRSLAAVKPDKDPDNRPMPLSRPNKASIAQRGAKGPDALQKQDQSFNSRSWPGGLRSLAAAQPNKDPRQSTHAFVPTKQSFYRPARRRGTGRPPEARPKLR